MLHVNSKSNRIVKQNLISISKNLDPPSPKVTPSRKEGARNYAKRLREFSNT